MAAAKLLALLVLNLVPLGSARSSSIGAGNAAIGTSFSRLPAAKVKMGKAKAEIHVCLSGTCSAHGGEAVLVEIEELASTFSEVCVRGSGCLGLCRQAPAALTVKFDDKGKADEKVHVRINSFEDSAKIVEGASGKKIPLEDEAVKTKFAHLRAARAREHAVAVFKVLENVSALVCILCQVTIELTSEKFPVFKWNAGLRGLAEQPALRAELQELLSKAGYPGGVKNWMPGCIKQ